MLQLRSFIQQRLHAAAEEILAQVEKTITLALSEADAHQPKEELRSLLQKLAFVDQASVTEPPLTNSSAAGEEVLQEAAKQEESNLSTAKVPDSSQTTADTETRDGSHCFVLSDFNNQTQKVSFPSPEVAQSEQEQQETQVSYELRPLSSDCSAAQSGSSSGEEWVQSKGAQTKTKRRKVLQRQNGSNKQKGQTSSPDRDSSAKSQKGRCVCSVCGKSFQYARPFVKHMQTHKKTSESTKEPQTYLQRDLDKRAVCDVCGKEFTNLYRLQMHSKIHKGLKDFKCQECGKTFNQKEHLVVHMRTHSGERPYRCGSCGKLFYTRGHLKTHMKRFSGEKPYSCDICGKIFCQRKQLVRHKDSHTAGSAE